MDWIGLDQVAGLGWIGSCKMDPCPTLRQTRRSTHHTILSVIPKDNGTMERWDSMVSNYTNGRALNRPNYGTTSAAVPKNRYCSVAVPVLPQRYCTAL